MNCIRWVAFSLICGTATATTVLAECAPGRIPTTVGGQTVCCKQYDANHNPQNPDIVNSCIPEDQSDTSLCQTIGELRVRTETKVRHKNCTTWFCDSSSLVPYDDTETKTQVQICSAGYGPSFRTICEFRATRVHECQVIAQEMCRSLGNCGQWVDYTVNKYAPIPTDNFSNSCGDSYPEAQQQHTSFNDLFHAPQQRFSAAGTQNLLPEAVAPEEDLGRITQDFNSVVRDLGEYDECPPIQP